MTHSIELAAPTAPRELAEHLELLRCPVCTGILLLADNRATLSCSDCRHSFGIDTGIPLLFWPRDSSDDHGVTELVKTFYEETPFPNYDDIDSAEALRQKAGAGLFAHALNDSIPYGVRILEAGCGTGQLSNFLALTWGRIVFATDISLNSLRLGHDFKLRNDIPNVVFLQMNLFRPVFRPETFDIVVSNGVLHHTADPFRGFQSLLACLKPNGLMIVGLYNTYGRLTTDLRRVVFRLVGDRARWLDPRLRKARIGPAKQRAWFMDQYRHPHESKHTIGEVLGWFDHCGVEFVNAVPKCVASDRFSPDEDLFGPNGRGTSLDHFLVQARMLITGGREGGFFMMMGRKRSP